MRSLSGGRWNSNLKAQVGVQGLVDGIYVIPFSLYYKYFNGFDICYYHDDFVYSSLKLIGELETPTVAQLRIPKKGLYYITVHQVNARAFRDSSSSFCFMRIRLLSAHDDHFKEDKRPKVALH